MKNKPVVLLPLALATSLVGTQLISYVFIHILSFSYTAYFLSALLYAGISYLLFRYTEVAKYRLLIAIFACTPIWLVVLIELVEYFFLNVPSNIVLSFKRTVILLVPYLLMLYILERNKRLFYVLSVFIFVVLFAYNFIEGKEEFKSSIETHPSHSTYHSVSNIYRDSVLSTNKDNVLILESIQPKKHLVLTFSSYVCSPCIRLKKNLLSISPESIDSALVINVLTAKDSSTYVKYIERYPNVEGRYITILDADSALYKSFKIEYFPQTYLVDKQGNIVWWYSGFNRNDNLWFADELKKRIAALPD